MPRFIRIATAAVLLGTAAAPAWAGMLAQVLPTKVNRTVQPGETVTERVTVANLGSAPVVVRPRWADLLVDTTGAVALAPPGTLAASFDTLARFEPAQFSLQPGETGQVKVTLTLPADGPATRWGVLLSEVRPAVVPAAQLGPRTTAELGTTFYLSRIPVDDIRAALTALDARSEGDSMRVSVRVKNAGERHFYAGGEVTLTDEQGLRHAGGTMLTGVVLPGAVRELAWSGARDLPPGRYRVTVSLDDGEPELLVGERWIDWQGPAQGTGSGPLARRSQR